MEGKDLPAILKMLGADDGHMGLLENRLKTFRNWIFADTMNCNAERMANAGFYFCGTIQEPDLARCYYCRKELDGWDDFDDPWEEHKSHARGNCAFINLAKPASQITVKDRINLEREKFVRIQEKALEKIKKEMLNVDSYMAKIPAKTAEGHPLKIQDFKKRVENIEQSVENKCIDHSKWTSTRAAVYLSKLSTDQKNSNVCQLLAAQKEHQESHDQENEMEDSQDSSNILDDSVIAKFKSVKVSGRAAAVSTVKKSTRKQRIVAATPRTSTRSTRKGAPPVLSTPMNTGMVPSLIGNTPMFTPKFDMSTPLHKSTVRKPRENENFAMSFNGSPLSVAPTRTGKRMPLNQLEIVGSQTTIQLPIGDDVQINGVEFDDEHYRKLEQLQKQVANILKMRANSTTTDSE